VRAISVFNGKIPIDFANLIFVFVSNAKDKVHRTIEDELVEAFVKVDAIPQAHADDMSKVCFVNILFLISEIFILSQTKNNNR